MPELQNGRTAAQQIFTTGQVARLCRVSPRTVAKWTDRGRLPCYHLPDCNDRRIHRADLIAFLIANRLPLGELHVPPPLIVLCGLGERMSVLVKRILTAAPPPPTNGSAVLHTPPVPPEVAVASGGGGISGDGAGGRRREVEMSRPKYDVTTWDSDADEFTPQVGVRRGPYTLFGLRKAIRKLRQGGYSATRFPRYRDRSGFLDGCGDPSVLIQRIDDPPAEEKDVSHD